MKKKQLKYIINNYPNKQIGSSFNNNDNKVFHLILYVTKELDDYFYTVLDNLHAKEKTIVELKGNIKHINSNKISNWHNENNKFTRNLNKEDFTGIFYIWDLINSVKNEDKEYILTNFNELSKLPDFEMFALDNIYKSDLREYEKKNFQFSEYNILDSSNIISKENMTASKNIFKYLNEKKKNIRFVKVNNIDDEIILNTIKNLWKNRE